MKETYELLRNIAIGYLAIVLVLILSLCVAYELTWLESYFEMVDVILVANAGPMIVAYVVGTHCIEKINNIEKLEKEDEA